MPDPDTSHISYSAEETYGDEGYVWPFESKPRQWDHALGGYPPGPGRPRGTKKADLSGQVFGHLTVVERIKDHTTPSGGKHPKYLCRCACGESVELLGQNLKAGRTKTCGCSSDELRETWRAEEREIRRDQVDRGVEAYIAWRDSDERKHWDRVLQLRKRRLNGLW